MGSIPQLTYSPSLSDTSPTKITNKAYYQINFSNYGSWKMINMQYEQAEIFGHYTKQIFEQRIIIYPPVTWYWYSAIYISAMMIWVVWWKNSHSLTYMYHFLSTRQIITVWSISISVRFEFDNHKVCNSVINFEPTESEFCEYYNRVMIQFSCKNIVKAANSSVPLCWVWCWNPNHATAWVDHK